MSLPLTRRGESTHADGDLASLIDYEAEFDRFVAALIPNGRPPRGTPGQSKTVMTAEAIYEYALVLLDAEGASALTARRLAEDLKISTRTLYKRIGNHDNLIRKIVELHFTKLAAEFSDAASREQTVWNWCNTLHGTLCAHPNLTELMTDQDAMVLVDDVEALADFVVLQGVSRNIADECCRSLVDVTISDASGRYAHRGSMRRDRRPRGVFVGPSSGSLRAPVRNQRRPICIQARGKSAQGSEFPL